MRVFSFISLKYNKLVYPSGSVIEVDDKTGEWLVDTNRARHATPNDISASEPVEPESTATALLTNPPSRKPTRRRASANPE
jgi:hypothetical protein